MHPGILLEISILSAVDFVNVIIHPLNGNKYLSILPFKHFPYQKVSLLRYVLFLNGFYNIYEFAPFFLWFSPPCNIIFSIILHDEIRPELS